MSQVSFESSFCASETASDLEPEDVQAALTLMGSRSYVEEPSDDKQRLLARPTHHQRLGLGEGLMEPPLQHSRRGAVGEQRSLAESSRLDFFKSLMPAVNHLDEDQFLALQIDVIQAVQRHKQKSGLPPR